VSVQLIREIHAELLRGVRGSRLTPGDLRRSQNWIGPGGCTLAEASFQSVKDVQALLGTTFAGANQIVQRLADLGIVAEITGQTRHRRFRYDTYVRLFD
jgi:Fic family protein